MNTENDTSPCPCCGLIAAAFYVVWRVGGEAPSRHHVTRLEASREAIRLARLHPGAEFYVGGGGTLIRTDHPKPPPTLVTNLCTGKTFEVKG